MTARGLFITGTDTGVGKTYVTARIAEQLAREGRRVGVYKPVASGCQFDDSDDPYRLWQAAGRPGELARVCPQQFRAPLAPHRAARAEGREVDAMLLRSGLEYWVERSDVLLVEGAGGLMSPVTDEEYVADLAHEFGFPLVVVAANVLGVINQMLQTLITAEVFREGLAVAGIVLNDPRPLAEGEDLSRASNRAELEARCGPPVLAELRYNAGEFDRHVDWFSLCNQQLSWGNL